MHGATVKLFELAKQQAARSNDDSNQVGCVIVQPTSHQVLAVGYNDLPRGIADKACRRERPMKYKYVEHAERNALYNACRRGTAVKGGIAAVTMFPCAECSRALIQSGIRTLVTVRPDMTTRWAEDFRISLEMLSEARVSVSYVPEAQL